MKLTCSNCANLTEWLVCKECSTLRKPLKKQHAITKHSNLHNNRRNIEQEKEVSTTVTRLENEITVICDPPTPEGELMDISDLEFDFSRGASTSYFKNEHTNRGAESIVCHSCFGEFSRDNQLDRTQQAMHIQMANLVCRISRPDRDLLADVLQKVELCMTQCCRYDYAAVLYSYCSSCY